MEGFSVDLGAVTGASGRVARLADQAHGLSGTVTACGDGLAGASGSQILSGTLTALTDRCAGGPVSGWEWAGAGLSGVAAGCA